MSNKGISKELLAKEHLAKSGGSSRWITANALGINEIGEFKAGIRTNIDVTDVLHNEERGTLDIIMGDEHNNKCYVSIFPPSMQYCQDNDKYEKTLSGKMKLMYSILCLPYYPLVFNDQLLDEDAEWDDMCEQIATEFTTKRDQLDQLLCAGVFTYNNKGYVGLRQSGYKVNICTMKELKDLNMTADKYFVINPDYDKFENPMKYAQKGEIFSKQENSEDDLPF